LQDCKKSTKSISGVVDYQNLEIYLTDGEFDKVFGGATREEVRKWKEWKKKYYKKQAGIW